MSSPKRDSGISADMTDDDSKFESVRDILKRFESGQTQLKLTPVLPVVIKLQKPEVPQKPPKLKDLTIRKPINDVVYESYQLNKLIDDSFATENFQSAQLKRNETMVEMRQKKIEPNCGHAHKSETHIPPAIK